MTLSGTPSETPAESVASTTESSTTTGSLTGIRRQRASYSCRSCRARRVKCDQVHPTCENCRKNGIVCVYPENTPKRAQTFGEPPDSNNRATRRRTEGGVRPRLGYLSLQSGGRSRYLENTFWATVDEEDLELDSLISELPLFPLDSYCCAAGQATNGEKRQHTAQCRHYAGTVEPNFALWVAEGGAEGHLTCRTLAKVLEELPSKATCDSMYAVFLEGVHPLIPLLHLPSFNDHYKEFWSWYETWDEEEVPEGVLAETPSFLPLLFAILFTAAFTSNGFENVEPNDSSQPEGPQTKLYRLTLSSLALVGFPQNPAIYSLCAFILAQNMLIREEESLSCSSFISVAFRISQAMGIHRDGTLFGLNPVQTEIRRRIWWHLMHNDVMVSTVSGLPPFILNEGYFDTQVPGEVKDELIGQSREGPNEDNDSYWLWPPYVLTVGRYQATDCIRSIVKRHFALIPMTSKDVRSLRESIDQLVEHLEDRMARLKALSVEEHSPFDPAQTSQMPRVFRAGSQSIEAFVGWSEAIFHILIGRAYCLLYQPLMRDPTLWPEFRDEAIPKIQAFMRTFINMCSSPAFRPFQWLYPGSWQPLQPTAALLIDMRKHPTSNDARESRIILDMLFSLLGPEGRITAGEGHINVGQRYMAPSTVGAWSLLDKLRRKVWRQLGLDSSVMWSRGLSESSDDPPSNSQTNSAGLTPANTNAPTNAAPTDASTSVTDDTWVQPASLDSFLDPVTSAAFDPFQAFTGVPDAFEGAGGFGSEFAPATDLTFDMSTMAGGLGVSSDFNPQLPEMWNAAEWTQWTTQPDGYTQH